MNRDDSPLLPHGGYRKLRSYVVAEAVYDATVVFCRRFLSDDRRMCDQMVQAARSGVRNISEGSGAAATSRKSEMLLTNVARASLNDELLHDYESFLRQNGLRVWPKDSRPALAMRERLRQDHVTNLPVAPEGRVRLTGLAGLAEFVGKAEAEIAANAMICAIQALYLDPLRHRVQDNGGRVYRDGPQFTLLIDVKTDAARTYPALAEALGGYADMLLPHQDQVREAGSMMTNCLSGMIRAIERSPVLSALSFEVCALCGRFCFERCYSSTGRLASACSPDLQKDVTIRTP